MLFYAQLQQMDGKWNDKCTIMVRKWMKSMSINDRKMDNSRAQHLPQTELFAYPHATQYLCSIQLEKLIHSFLHFTIRIAAARRNREFNTNWQSHLAEDLAENLAESQLFSRGFSRNLVESQLIFLAENLAKGFSEDFGRVAA